jgi:hypothetical protein
MGNFNKEGQIKVWEAFQKGGMGSFAVKHFYNGYENLIQTPNFVFIKIRV